MIECTPSCVWSCCVRPPTMPLCCRVSNGSVPPLLLVYTFSPCRGNAHRLHAALWIHEYAYRCCLSLLFISRKEARRRDEDEHAKAFIAPKP